MRSEPDQGVLAWMSSQPLTALFTTTITQAEVWTGAAAGRAAA
nr:hypothetical protein [Gluconacetobacter sacchari]